MEICYRSDERLTGKAAAELLDVHPNTLRARMQKLGIRHSSLNMVNR